MYRFSIIIQPPAEEEAAADRLYSRCGDALISASGGIWEISFDREAATLADAVSSAMRDVELAGLGPAQVDFSLRDR